MKRRPSDEIERLCPFLFDGRDGEDREILRGWIDVCPFDVVSAVKDRLRDSSPSIAPEEAVYKPVVAIYRSALALCVNKNRAAVRALMDRVREAEAVFLRAACVGSTRGEQAIGLLLLTYDEIPQIEGVRATGRTAKQLLEESNLRSQPAREAPKPKVEPSPESAEEREEDRPWPLCGTIDVRRLQRARRLSWVRANKFLNEHDRIKEELKRILAAKKTEPRLVAAQLKEGFPELMSSIAPTNGRIHTAAISGLGVASATKFVLGSRSLPAMSVADVEKALAAARRFIKARAMLSWSRSR